MTNYCPVCGAFCGISWLGKINLHEYDGEPCPGSGYPPAKRHKPSGKYPNPLSRFTDQELAKELERRGYTVFRSNFTFPMVPTNPGDGTR